MSDIDVQFVEYVVKSLVNKPEAVKIERRIDEKGVLLELTVDPEDLGRVIGKRGATAQSIRTLLRALGTKNDARYNLKIIDNGIQDYASRHSDDNPAPAVSDDSQAPSDAPADVPADEPVADAPVDEQSEPVTEPEPEEVKEEAPAEVETSDRLSQTRKELEELDDLDV